MNTQEIKITNAQTISINAKMQDKVVTPSLEQQTILPDENYNSLSKVVVNAVTLENKIVHPNRDTQIITPTESLGLSSVTIEPVSLEEKSIAPTKEVQVLNPSNEYVGFSQVTVEKIPEEYIIPNGNLDIKNNGDFDVTENATVNVNVQPNLQEKETRITAPTNIFVHPDEEYDGLSFVNVIASVDTETKEVTPSKEVQTINRSEGKYIDGVTVNAIPDEYIVPSGEMEITENGSYDVTDKASVKVETSGADLSEYFNVNPSETTTGNANVGWAINNYFLKLPDITLQQENSDCFGMFRDWNLSILPKITNTRNIKRAKNMFAGCQTKNYDFSDWDTSNITDMDSMFTSCSIEELDLTNWDTNNVINANNMFRYCYAKKILAPNLVTNKFEDTPTIEYCSSLETLDISNWDTSSLTSMREMFYNCKNLTKLDLSHFDTTNVIIYYYFCRTCANLTDLNISSFDFSKATIISSMLDSPKITNLQFGYNLGKGYTAKTANKYEYKLNLSPCKLLTHDSLMSVINGLYDLNLTYDVANGGTLYTQDLVLGTDNLAKLTEEEIAIATAKGWTVS